MAIPTPAPSPSTAQLSRWVLGYALRRRLALVAVSATMLLKAGLDVLKPWPMLFLVDHVLQTRAMSGWLSAMVSSLPGSHDRTSLVAWSVGATVLVFLLSWALGLAATFSGVTLGQRMVYDLASDLFARLQQLSLRFHARQSVGDNIRRVTTDCTCVSVIFKDALLPVASAVVSLLVMFGVMIRIDATLTVVALAVVPCMFWVFRCHAQPMLDLSYRQQEVEAGLYSLVERTFAAIPAVQAFCAEERNDRRLAGLASATIDATLDLTRVQLRFKILMGLTTALGTAAILWFGSRAALDGRVSVGMILLFLSYLGSLYAPLEAVTYTTTIIQGAAGSARRVLEVLQAEQEIQDQPGAMNLTEVRGHIQFERVAFAYTRERPVLRGVNLEAKPGDCIAFVGASGAGKTTLASLVPRFIDPQEGRVLLDGRDLRAITVRSLRRHVAVVPQEPFLFPISVAESIAYGRPRAAQAEIEAAAKAARAHEFIVQLPKGYRTPLCERGSNLSVGQRQRLAIARALLKDAPILILDEPTSALDAETEQSLMEALNRLMAGRTTFIIAHRLSTIRRATCIVFLKDGLVAEMGAHEELLARGGLYAAFHTSQFQQ